MDDCAEASDEELVLRVRAGDAEASRVLFSRHEDLLRRLARQRIAGSLRRKVGASDIVQETYAAAFAGLADFEDRGPGSFRAWLERILDCRAKDQVKRHVRAEKRSVRNEESCVSGTGADAAHGPVPTPSVVAMGREEGEALRRALDAMGADDRLVLTLVRDHGRDFVAVGQAMGRSADAARKLYARAVVRLGDRMGRPA